MRSGAGLVQGARDIDGRLLRAERAPVRVYATVSPPARKPVQTPVTPEAVSAGVLYTSTYDSFGSGSVLLYDIESDSWTANPVPDISYVAASSKPSSSTALFLAVSNTLTYEKIWNSTDGISWTGTTNPSTPTPGAYSGNRVQNYDISTGSRIIGLGTVWDDADASHFHNEMWYSDNFGATWTATYAMPSDHTGIGTDEADYILTNPTARANAVIPATRSIAPFFSGLDDIYIYTSGDSGATWTRTLMFASHTARYDSREVWLPSGRYLYLLVGLSPRQLYPYYSDDNGASFTLAGFAPTVNNFGAISVAVSDAGSVYASVYDSGWRLLHIQDNASGYEYISMPSGAVSVSSMICKGEDLYAYDYDNNAWWVRSSGSWTQLADPPAPAGDPDFSGLGAMGLMP